MYCRGDLSRRRQALDFLTDFGEIETILPAPMQLVLDTVVPVFAVVALGYWLGGRRGAEARPLADLALMVASPALLFSVLGGSEVDLARMGRLAGAAAVVMAGTGALAALYVRTTGVGRGFVLPSVFWNAGNMGLAFSRLAFGEAGLDVAAVLFVTVAFFNSLFGVWVAKGESGFAEAMRMPLLYGAGGGIALAITGVTLPRMVMEPIEMVGAMAIPLMLLTLGLQLRALRVADARHALASVSIRMLGGFACMSLFVATFDVTGVDRQVLLLISVMPPAVINVVMAERYGTDPPLVASSIVLGSLCSLACSVLPLGAALGGVVRTRRRNPVTGASRAQPRCLSAPGVIGIGASGSRSLETRDHRNVEPRQTDLRRRSPFDIGLPSTRRGSRGGSPRCTRRPGPARARAARPPRPGPAPPSPVRWRR